MGCLKNVVSHHFHTLSNQVVSLRFVPLFIVRPSRIAEPETKMLGEENNFIKKEEFDQERDI